MQAQARPCADTKAAGQGNGHRPPEVVMHVGLQAAADIGSVLESQ